MASSSYQIIRYTPEWKGGWDAFVDASRNATFLHRRDFMDYHAHRFTDRSYLALKNGKLVALLPANYDEATATLHSHQGLTYGSWLLPPRHIDGADLLDIFHVAMQQWRLEGVKEVIYKSIPFIYHSTPTLEDEYAMFRLGAERFRTDLSMAIDLRNPLAFSTLRKRSLKKCAALPVIIREETDLAPFHALLTSCLAERHNATPVHSLAELELLRNRFPANIRIFTASLNNVNAPVLPSKTPPLLPSEQTETPPVPPVLPSPTSSAPSVQAAVCVFDTGLVAHAQYICTSSVGRELDLLTPLFHHLITNRFADRRYFDFGISNEDAGRTLNATLLHHKASFGATGHPHHHYHLTL